ncbi:glucosamine-6-phosphate deaminase [bacterium]|nr:glucosamine-6-phosphate deaminase [bacterium]
MRVIIVKNDEEMGKKATDLIAGEMKKKTSFVLGLATGSTPLPLYKDFVERSKAGEMDFSTVITFNLDEYVGLDPAHNQSYRYFMNENLFDHVNILKKNTHVPNGMAEDIDASCHEYEKMIDEIGGIDYQVLGIGGNGHIGFNEPGSSLGSLTRIKTLTAETISDNARFFEKKEDVPTQAITMGIGTIMKSRKIVLLAAGANKADAIRAALEGPITSMCPSSALQLHRFVTYVITEDCATKLTLNYETV